MRIVICDSDPVDLEGTASILRACDYSGGCFISCMRNARRVLDFFENGAAVDIVFTEIMMPRISGISLAERLRARGFNGMLVFISSTNNYAAQSYRVGAFSYLLKPVSKEVLQPVIANAEKCLSTRDRSGFPLKWRGGGKFVFFRELVYVEVQNHHLYFHMNNGDVIKIFASLMDYAQKLLADNRMERVNRSFVVNMDYIIRYEHGAIFLKDGTRISVSQRLEQFKSAYSNWGVNASNDTGRSVNTTDQALSKTALSTATRTVEG